MLRLIGLQKLMQFYSRLSTNLKSNTTLGGLGVVDGLGSSLDVTADTVVVAGGERVEVVQAVNSDRVLGRIVTDSSSVLGELALGDVVGSLGTNKESITANNAVSSNSRSLMKLFRTAYLSM
jgi:hypothetical protein